MQCLKLLDIIVMIGFRKPRTVPEAGKENPRSTIVHSPADKQARKANDTKRENIAKADVTCKIETVDWEVDKGLCESESLRKAEALCMPTRIRYPT
jgi:hypothetical protein